VGFKEFGLVNGQLFLVMEYVKTIELRSILNPLREIPRFAFHAIACQGARSSTTRMPVRWSTVDIKPTNILLSKPTRKLHVKLADFGVSKLSRPASAR
jgi:serine/threonine protein kinase